MEPVKTLEPVENAATPEPAEGAGDAVALPKPTPAARQVTPALDQVAAVASEAI